jgi:peroxiredoxin
MRMRKLASIAVLPALGVSLAAAAPVPRKSPEFTIVEPSAKQRLVSSFRGKVVVIEFLLTTCSPCWRVAHTMTKLHQELGPRGFQPIGVAFDTGISGPVVTDFVRRFGVTYLVGYASSDKVDNYLGRGLMERFRVPQIVVIDRTGVIRAQSPGKGDPKLENESDLRNLINSLLKEGEKK